ncbi:MAG TPA: TonB-dependent receptor [Vicinamibacterales bacterium]|nr:TonB-dependent receptor [Vicinamibacterales bacterium]
MWAVRRTVRMAVLLAGAAIPAAAQTTTPPPQQPAATAAPSPVADEDIIVVTASRREEQLLNAPATMTVLTEDVLSTGPGQSVTELLRLVPGLNTIQTSARDVNVTSRGATSTLSDSMLVLFDGRSIYQDFFGSVLWDFLPVDTTEIKQVEVIRGPASAVWGANAMTGVVNVVSKTPREMQGTSVSIRFGQFDRSPTAGEFDGGGLFSINATHARATSERFAYKLSGGFLAQEAFLRPTGAIPGTGTPYPGFENRGTRQPKLDARVDYDTPERHQKLVVAGGISGTEGIIHTGLGPLDAQRGSTLKYGRMTYTRDRLKLQAFVNALDGNALVLLLGGPDGHPLDFRFENQVYDVEVSDFRLIRTRHVLSYGGNYRHNNFDLSFARGGKSRDEGGAYLQDQVLLSERYRWIVGARVDRFDVLKKAVLSPRTAFLIKPRPNHTFRISFNRAFRAPSMVNTFLDTSFVNQVDLGTGAAFSFPTTAVGNPLLREERLTAYEVGYIGKVGRTTLGAALYESHTRNLIQFTQAAGYTSSAPPPGWPLPSSVLDALITQGRGLPARFTYRNFDNVTDRGLELSAETSMTPAISAFVNYSWQANPRPTGFDISEFNLPPAHRFNVGASGTRGRYFANMSASFVDGAFWQDVLPGYQGTTNAYTLVDAGIGARSTDRRMTVAFRGKNLLNKPIQQHVFGDIIRRTVTGEVRFDF